MSGMPMTGMPLMAAPGKPSKTGLIVLSVLTALFVLAAGVMTTLFLQQRGEAQKANSQVVTLGGQLNQTKAKAEQLQRDLDNAKRDVTDAKAATDEVTTQKKTLADCLNAIYDYWDALDKAADRETTTVESGARGGREDLQGGRRLPLRPVRATSRLGQIAGSYRPRVNGGRHGSTALPSGQGPPKPEPVSQGDHAGRRQAGGRGEQRAPRLEVRLEVPVDRGPRGADLDVGRRWACRTGRRTGWTGSG